MRTTTALGLFCIGCSALLFLTLPSDDPTTEHMAYKSPEEVACALYRITRDPTAAVWNGTGVAVANTEEGAIIMTAAHVVAERDPFGNPLPPVIGTVMCLDIPNLPDVAVKCGTVLTYLEGSDVALVLIPDFVAPVVLDVSDTQPEFGEAVTQWGTVPFGIVCQKGYVGKVLLARDLIAPDYSCFMVNILIFGGCSGGPILNWKDEVVGIVSWMYYNVPVTLVIPTANLQEVLRQADL